MHSFTIFSEAHACAILDVPYLMYRSTGNREEHQLGQKIEHPSVLIGGPFLDREGPPFDSPFGFVS